MDAFISCLPIVLRAAGEAPEVVESAAVVAFNHAVGEGLREHAVPIKLDGQTLMVAVKDSVWQKQLTPVLGEVLFRVNRLLGQPVVSFIELQIDETAFANKTNRQETKPEPSTTEVPIQLWAAANAILDKELRHSFLKAALSQSKRSE